MQKTKAAINERKKGVGEEERREKRENNDINN